MVSSMSVGAFLAIRYMQSPEFERTLKNKLMGSLENKIEWNIANKSDFSAFEVDDFLK